MAGSRAFFSAEKKQKTFGPAVAESPSACTPGNKNFLVLFLKKNRLPATCLDVCVCVTVSHNTLLHRLIRPVVARVATTGLLPNHVTGLRIATALVAAAAFSVGSVQAIRIGSVLFVVSALLDRADGELARQTGRFSKWGHVLDLAGDCSADALTMLAVGAGATGSWLGWWAPVLGVSGAVSTGVIFWQLNHPSQQPLDASAHRLFDPDDAVLGIPLLACCVGLPPVLLLAGGFTPLVAGWLLTRQPQVRTQAQ